MILASNSSPEHLARVAGADIDVCRLIFAVAEHDPENVALIRSSRIDEDTLRQRRAVILVARLIGKSLPTIARAMGRDHSSVQRSAWEGLLHDAADPEFRRMCERLRCALPRNEERPKEREPDFDFNEDLRRASGG